MHDFFQIKRLVWRNAVNISLPNRPRSIDFLCELKIHDGLHVSAWYVNLRTAVEECMLTWVLPIDFSNTESHWMKICIISHLFVGFRLALVSCSWSVSCCILLLPLISSSSEVVRGRRQIIVSHIAPSPSPQGGFLTWIWSGSFAWIWAPYSKREPGSTSEERCHPGVGN